MKLKFKGLLVLVLLAHLFSTNLAWACSPRLSFDVVGRCTPDGSELVLLSLPGFPADFERDLALLQTSLTEFALQCEVATQATTEQIRAVFTAWTNRYSPDGERLIYDNNTLIFEAYSTESEAELKTIEQALHICNYYKSERIGDWLVLAYQSRPYCGANIVEICANDIYFLPFLAHLITQPSPAATFYLMLFLLVTTLTTALFYQLLTRKFIKLGCLVNLLIVTPFTLGLSFFIWPQTVQLAGWVLSCYLLAYGWYAFNHLKKKNKELSQITLFK